MNKKTRRIFSIIAALAMVVSMMQFSVATVSAQGLTYCDFEGGNIFFTTGNISNNTFETVSDDTQHQTVYKLGSKNRNNAYANCAYAYANLPSSVNSGAVTISFEMKSTTSNTPAFMTLSPSAYTTTPQDTIGTEIKTAAFGSYGLTYFSPADGKSWITATGGAVMQTNRWYQVDVVADYDQNSISFYYDGVLAATRDMYTGLTAIKGICLCQQSTNVSGSTDVADLYVDNFSVSTNDNPVLSVENILISSDTTTLTCNLSDTITDSNKINATNVKVVPRFSDQAVAISAVTPSYKKVAITLAAPLTEGEEYQVIIDTPTTCLNGEVYPACEGSVFVAIPTTTTIKGTFDFEGANPVTATLSNNYSTYNIVDSRMGTGKAYQIKTTSDSGTYRDSIALLPLGDAKIKPNDGKYELTYKANVWAETWNQWNPKSYLSGFAWNQTATAKGDQWNNELKLAMLGINADKHYCSYFTSYAVNNYNATATTMSQNNNTTYDVKLAINTTEGTIKYYYNNQYVGETNNIATPGGKTIKNGLMALQFGQMYGCSGKSCYYQFDDICVKKINETKQLTDVTFTDYRDKEVFANATIPTAMKQLRLSFSDAVTEADLNAVELLAGGVAVGVTPVVNTTDRTVTYTFDNYLTPETEYTLNVLGESKIFTTQEGQFIVSNLRLEKDGTAVENINQLQAGDTVTALIDITNCTGSPKSMFLSVAAYDGTVMKAVSQETINSDETLRSVEITIPTAENLCVRAFAWNNADDMIPLLPNAEIK